jgi:hypothetical protein
MASVREFIGILFNKRESSSGRNSGIRLIIPQIFVLIDMLEIGIYGGFSQRKLNFFKPHGQQDLFSE